MSTAMVSQFYDVDVLAQNRKNMAFSHRSHSGDTGRLISGNSHPQAHQDYRNLAYNYHINSARNMAMPTTPESPVSPPLSLHPCLGKSNSSGSSPIIGARDSIRRRLDRSMSEGVVVERSGSPTSSTSSNGSSSGRGANINSSRYKTELCRPFEENGYCKYGEKCQFAHGGHELRSLSRHPKYKTELCRTFHTVGFCPYGPRCHFIHNEEERRAGSASSPIAMRAQPALPLNVHKPRVLDFNLPLPLSLRESLGSTADSPPASVTDSPNMSPTLGLGASDDLGCFSTGYPSPSTTTTSAPAALNMLHFNNLPAELDLSHAADLKTSTMLDLAALHYQHQQLQRSLPIPAPIKDINMNFLDSLDMMVQPPPSPPESTESLPISTPTQQTPSSTYSVPTTCASPLDVSRSLFRLPIFSQLSLSEV